MLRHLIVLFNLKVIELLDSSDDESKQSTKSPQSQSSQPNKKHTSEKKNVTKNEYIYEEWGIKKSDCIKLSSRKVSKNDEREFRLKYFRMGRYVNEAVNQSNESNKNYLMNLSLEGIHINLLGK